MLTNRLVLPAAYGAGGKAQLLSLEEGVGKMRAALAARSDPDLVVLGRTSAMAVTGLADALARVRAYAATGVDGIFLVGVRTREELQAVAEVAGGLPIVLGGVPAALSDTDWLAQAGVRVCLQGHQPFAAGVAAVQATLSALRQGVAPVAITGVASAELMRRVTRQDDVAQAAHRFLGGAPD